MYILPLEVTFARVRVLRIVFLRVYRTRSLVCVALFRGW